MHWAARNAELRNLPLTLVHAVPTTVIRATSRLRVYGLLELPHQQVRRILDDALNIVLDGTRHGDPLRMVTKVVSTDPVSALADLSHEAELIVVGSRRRDVLRRALCQSIGFTLVGRCHCPVAIIQDRHPRMPHPAHAPVDVRISGW